MTHDAELRETARVSTLLDDVGFGEERADKLNNKAEESLAAAALEEKDLSGAIQAVKTAATVLAQARGYMELRGELSGELGRDRSLSPVSIQILCPTSASTAETLPRIAFLGKDQIERDSMSEIGQVPGSMIFWRARVAGES